MTKLNLELKSNNANVLLPTSLLTNYQKRILFELAMGGKIFAFQFPDGYGFDDVDGNSYSFRKDTFDKLMNNGFIEVAERPSLTCQIYGLTKKAETLLAVCRQRL